jgi:hypothetical protein
MHHDGQILPEKEAAVVCSASVVPLHDVEA